MKFHNYSLLLVLSLIICNKISFSQSNNLPLQETYLLDGKYYINPSFAGANKEIEARFNYKTFSDSNGNAPIVYTASVDGSFRRVGLGLIVFGEQDNPSLNQTGFHATFSYHIPLKQREEKRDRLSFGLSFQGVNFSSPSLDLDAETQNDPLLQGDSQFFARANVGVHYKMKDLLLGFAINNIDLDNPVSDIEPSNTLYNLYASYDFKLNNDFSITPSTHAVLNENSDLFWDLNAKVNYDINDRSNIALGVSYRHLISDDTDNSSLNLSPFLTLKVNSFRLGYAYTSGLTDSSLNNVFGDSHTISIGFDLFNPYHITRQQKRVVPEWKKTPEGRKKVRDARKANKKYFRQNPEN